ncbi:MAG: hypothetical protein AAGU27_26860 [Dehalobacterium sp.]
MSLKFTFLEDVLDTDLIPEFSICSDQADIFSMTRLQCSGNLSADTISGPRPIDPKHRCLCFTAILQAINNNSDILVTPEYSIPLDVITTIVRNSDLQPSPRKVFAFCCEAATVNEFKQLIALWETMGAHVVKHSIETEVIEKHFINALIYIFRLSNCQLCLVPQLKTKHMADKFLQCEGSGLSLGSTIFVFGRNSRNRFCSLICADSLHHEINKQHFLPTGNEHIIVFHPQLNPHPRQSAFSALRKQFYTFADGNKVIYITANWAEGTIARDARNGGTVQIHNPWSCIYIKNEKQDWYSSLVELIKINHCHGIGFSYWKPHWVNIWYSFKEENLQLIHVKKPNPSGACPLQPHEVVAESTYIPSATRTSWVNTSSCFNVSLPALFSQIPSQFHYPNHIPLDQRDRFFGLCFGHFEEGQFAANDVEICSRLGLYIDEECQPARQISTQSFLGLVHCLESLSNPIYPPGTNISFGLSNTHKYNVFNTSPRRDDRGMLAVYIEYEFDRKRTIEHLRRKLHDSEYKRTVIFTHEPMRRSPQAERLKINKQVSSSQRKSDNTSIVRRGQSYV